jgi:hypothetical protein
MNIGEKLFSRRPGENEDVAAKRIKRNKRIFRDALDNTAGHELLRLLYSVSHPLAPRFTSDAKPEQAAFLDGEKHTIGILWLNGTSEKTFTPQQEINE